MILIVFHHVISLSDCFEDWVTSVIGLVEIFFSVIYFLQLKNNLKKYFRFQEIEKPINWLASSYVGMAFVVIFMSYQKFYHLNVKSGDPVFLTVFLIIFLIGINSIINFFIQYIRIGKKMLNYRPEIKEFKIVGYFYLITPFLVIPLIILYVTKTYKDWRHILIITEILPLWYMANVYDKLLNEKDGVETISEQDEI